MRAWWIVPIVVSCKATPSDPAPAPSVTVAVVGSTAEVVPRPLDDPDAALPEGRIQARHILITWSGAKYSKQTRSKEEARKRAEEILGKLKAGSDFVTLAGEYGEDGTRSRGVDLGVFAKKDMVAPFADAAFALAIGELSGIVETDHGYHLILLVR